MADIEEFISTSTSELYFPHGLLVDGDFLYIVNRDHFRIDRIDLTESSPSFTTVVSFPTASPIDILKYEGEFYISLCMGGSKVVKLAETVTSVNEFNFNESSVYPNPTSDRIYLDLNEQVDRFIIFDIQGRELEPIVKYDANRIEFDLSDKTNGAYQLVLFKEDQIQTHRFIKQ